MQAENNQDCSQCLVEPGQVHMSIDDGLARCRFTGAPGFLCVDFHKGECEPDVWDGEYPGIKECREYGLTTSPDSIWGEAADLNTLMFNSTWDVEQQKYIYPRRFDV